MKYDEGYIKFNLNWERKKFDFSNDIFLLINSFRRKLFSLELIGLYPDGIGFGNISFRHKRGQFIISGSATGGIKDLTKDHFALVTDFKISENTVDCIGLTKASSESMSHAAIYKSNQNVNAVIHVHHDKMWEKYRNILPTTIEKAEFGTPEMAYEIEKLVKSDNGIIIMEGHPEGIITFGESLKEAYNILINYYKNI